MPFIPLALGVWAIAGIAGGSTIFTVGTTTLVVRGRRNSRFARAWMAGGDSAVLQVALALSPKRGEKHFEKFLDSKCLTKVKAAVAAKAVADATAAAAA